jgi:antitoxin component HigA of HigAB toxin-antitoxin module
MNEKNSTVIELTEKEVEDFKRALKELKSMIKETFDRIPINSDPETTFLYEDCMKVVQMYKEAIKTKKWNKNNNEFVIRTIQHLKELNSMSYFFF